MSKAPASPPVAALALTPAQLGVLASSTRLAIIQRLDVDGQASARELAERLGRPVTALYHHMVQLENAGLIAVVGQRATGRRPEAVYAVVSRQLSSADAMRTASGRRNLAKVAASAVGASLRAFAAMVTSAAARFEGPQRNCTVRHLAFRADAARLARLNALIDALEQAGLEAGDAGDSMLMTVVLTQVPARRGE
ncbi:helix-turn-helix domain-containing protein [Stenotrophomonas sp. 24(2023)]|uniref:helix-turn-helix domain-containing protein n=1 Tax=Stenotrophomonas sp. 24(2023) TaxID=3068324 RepID=UPI0027DFC312|nr:helix-turn-helix domain-containing protein [Stenotrophomonas sp. 24(2023)]WMJ69227.1 helix-turn-helix domain-containing protein [Stenotrophomonas sp. 24(2023)]